MTNINSQSKWATVKKLMLALPFLAVLVAAVPSAQADDHYGRLHREERREGYYRHGYGYYHGGRYYHHRRYYYRHGRRYYGYYGPVSGVSVNIGL